MTNNVSTPADDQNEFEFDYSLSDPQLVIFGFSICVIILTAVIGNILTIISFMMDKQLHTVYNIYIVNLATTDFLLASFTMVLYGAYTLLEYTWVLGYHLCKILYVVDFTLCFESTIIMIILSHDRILLVREGANYLKKETKTRACVKVAISWVISFLLYSPAIIFMDLWTDVDILADEDCDTPFAQDFIFTTVTAVCEFVIPLFLIVILNAIIYYEIRKRRKILPKAKDTSFRRISSETREDSNNKSDISSANVERDKDISGEEAMSDVSTISCTHQEHNSSNIKNKTKQPETTYVKTLNGFSDNKVVPTKATSQENKNSRQDITRRDLKAAKYLAILVIVFLVTWAPYTFLTIVISFCEDCVNNHAYEILTWLLWTKCAINPFLYAFNNKRFRLGYKKIITSMFICKRGRIT